ncbi:MAG: hypothetical protein ACK55Z_29425 [bacterium]
MCGEHTGIRAELTADGSHADAAAVCSRRRRFRRWAMVQPRGCC